MSDKNFSDNFVYVSPMLELFLVDLLNVILVCSEDSYVLAATNKWVSFLGEPWTEPCCEYLNFRSRPRGRMRCLVSLPNASQYTTQDASKSIFVMASSHAWPTHLQLVGEKPELAGNALGRKGRKLVPTELNEINKAHKEKVSLGITSFGGSISQRNDKTVTSLTMEVEEEGVEVYICSILGSLDICTLLLFVTCTCMHCFALSFKRKRVGMFCICSKRLT